MKHEKRGLAGKLNRLFASVPRPDGKEYTNEQVAEAVRSSKLVKTLSQSYIWQLRNGVKDNPTYAHLRGLAAFFEVPVSYFVDDDVTDRIDEKLAKLRAERERMAELAGNSEARLIAMRAGELSPQGRRQVIELLNVVHELEKVQRNAGAGQDRAEYGTSEASTDSAQGNQT
ncbi:XRE family transcriptional regulator [Amycolatopsis magusensis]|uniref:XRE family transcriptional regulator n=1 Tax=Amycolatopsis magusensis TaxID=882444 RepID=UPI0024A991A3|nr:XRE family transcriptional regulator [Amycolatopsis magusensis]MDI5977986.1 XRE family transcriptional regulator [Amycolatopsis magusensis]